MAATIEMEDASTPNKNMNLGFPDNSISTSDDPRADIEAEPIPWRNVPLKQWFRIIGERNVTRRASRDTNEKQQELEADKKIKIIKLLSPAGEEFRAWMSGVLCANLDSVRESKRTELSGKSTMQDLYVKSCGLKASISNPQRSYFDAEFMYW